MSFSITIPKTPVADFDAAAATAKAAYLESLGASDYELDPAAVESVDAAIAAASQIVKSGAVGTGTVQAGISGHANPGHQPTAGWANDSLTVSVYCADAYVAPTSTTAVETPTAAAPATA